MSKTEKPTYRHLISIIRDGVVGREANIFKYKLCQNKLICILMCDTLMPNVVFPQDDFNKSVCNFAMRFGCLL